ncbi:MAG TPA: hypothetical protein VE912_23300 [Bacteroidales bacterium]|nr:hypothetical protein [Bacteroidales bacterium]
MNIKGSTWSFLIFTGSIVLIASGVFYEIRLTNGEYIPELTLTLLLLSSVVVFLIMIIASVSLLNHYKLTNSNEAFGLPSGSVRAILALSLLIIFAISSLYLYTKLKDPGQIYKITNLTKNQVDSLKAVNIIAKYPNEKNPSHYDIEGLDTYNTTASNDFAKQVITIISTLLVAISGFYFGAKVSKQQSSSESESPSLNIISPETPVNLTNPPYDPLNAEPILIITETKPPGLAIKKNIAGDDPKSLETVDYNKFRYSPSKIPDGNVIISLKLASHPEILKEIIVKRP